MGKDIEKCKGKHVNMYLFKVTIIAIFSLMQNMYKNAIDRI